MRPTAFPFAVDQRLRPLARLFLIHPETCTFIVDAERAVVVFGRWRLAVALTNVDTVSVTGPYRWWKVAGPPHISMKDRGATFATTGRAGVCLKLRYPVAAIDPFAFVRHPGITVTVDDPERVAAFVESAIAGCQTTPPTRLEPGRAWPYARGSRVAALRALWRWRARTGSSVVCRDTELMPNEPLEPPMLGTTASAAVQTIDEGVGSEYRRRYRVEVETDLSAATAMRRIQDDMNMLSDPRLAPINKLAGEIGTMRLGDRLVVALAGPWSGPVEVVGLTPTSFRLATLAGHLEAGQIEFRAVPGERGLRFEIESWARSGGTVMRVLYDVLGLASQLQAEMWVEACESFASTIGHQCGPVEVTTQRRSATRSWRSPRRREAGRCPDEVRPGGRRNRSRWRRPRRAPHPRRSRSLDDGG